MIQTPRELVLIGNPVEHSLSPVMQRAALDAADIPVSYTALHVEHSEVATVLDEIRQRGLAGNVTIPYKRVFFESCDSISPLAARIGAINTFWMQGDRLCGDNTDIGGFDSATRQLLQDGIENLNITLLGAGGSAAAVVAALSSWPGSKITVWNRSLPGLNQLKQDFDTISVEMHLPNAVMDADLVVNATPVGLDGISTPIDISLLPKNAAIIDLVYGPNSTPLIREAKAKGHLAADGTGMLVEQGALAFRRWFGINPDKEVMWRAIMKEQQIRRSRTG